MLEFELVLGEDAEQALQQGGLGDHKVGHHQLQMAAGAVVAEHLLELGYLESVADIDVEGLEAVFEHVVDDAGRAGDVEVEVLVEVEGLDVDIWLEEDFLVCLCEFYEDHVLEIELGVSVLQDLFGDCVVESDNFSIEILIPKSLYMALQVLLIFKLHNIWTDFVGYQDLHYLVKDLVRSQIEQIVVNHNRLQPLEMLHIILHELDDLLRR